MSHIPEQAASLVDGIISFDDVFDALEAEWSPDRVPLTTAMGDLGRAVAERAAILGSESVETILGRLENILANGTEEEKNAAATGFLEAVAVVVDQSPNLRWVLDKMGEESRRYLGAWNEFCGTE